MVEGSVLPANRLFLTRIGDLNLPEAHLDVKVDVTEPTTATVTVATTTFAYFVRVLTPWPGARPDISALDLRPGTKAVVTVTGLPEGSTPMRSQFATSSTTLTDDVVGLTGST